MTAAVCLALAACDDPDSPTVRQPASPPLSQWEIGPVIAGTNYSHNVPLHPLPTPDGFAIDFPESDGVHYVTMPSGPLVGHTQIVMSYRVEMDEGASLHPSSQPDAPTIGPVIYFERQGDDWNTDGYRWWASFNMTTPIEPGTYTITVPLDDARYWSSSNVKDAIKNPDDFLAAKQHTACVGFTLGGGTGLGHGVFATGHVRLVVTQFEVQ
jgi:hypothetical protein